MKGDLFVDVLFFLCKMHFVPAGSLGTGSGGGKAVVLQGVYVVGGSGISSVVFNSKRAAVLWDEGFHIPTCFGE